MGRQTWRVSDRGTHEEDGPVTWEVLTSPPTKKPAIRGRGAEKKISDGYTEADACATRQRRSNR